MKMRKLLAVILAVTLAISAMAISVFASAMAISVFADEYEVEMYNYSSTTTVTGSTSYSITVPAYYFYGYLTAGNSFSVTLPTNLTATASTSSTVDQSSYYAYYNATTKKISVADPSTSTLSVVTTDEYGSTATYLTVIDGTAVTTTEVTDTYNPNGGVYTSNYVYLGIVSELYSDTYSGGVYYYPSYNLGVTYTMTVNGVEVTLASPTDFDSTSASNAAYGDTSVYSVYTQNVDIGNYALSYYYSWTGANSNGVNQYGLYVRDAMVPQSTSLSTTDTITITATVDWSAAGSDVTTYAGSLFKNWWPTYGVQAYGDTVSVVVNDANGSAVSYTALGVDMAVAAAGTDSGSTSTQNNVVIIADTTSATTATTSITAGNAVLYWNHNLENRMYMLNAANTEGATAKLVVELADSIYGYAVYTLAASAEAVDSTYSTSWSESGWYTSIGTNGSALGLYNTTVDTYVLSGETVDTLEFDVDPSLLYNNEYGVYNGSMWINELLTLSETETSTGLLPTKYYTNSDTYALEATRVYLLITIPSDDDVVDTDEPVEEGDTKTEDDGEDADSVDVGDVDDTPAETNPTTGIVLALVPMAVAAAAAVASKRR